MTAQPLSVGVKGALALTGVGRHSLMAAIHSGALPAARFGAPDSKRPRYLIRVADLDAWLEQLTKQAA